MGTGDIIIYAYMAGAQTVESDSGNIFDSLKFALLKSNLG